MSGQEEDKKDIQPQESGTEAREGLGASGSRGPAPKEEKVGNKDPDQEKPDEADALKSLLRKTEEDAGKGASQEKEEEPEDKETPPKEETRSPSEIAEHSENKEDNDKGDGASAPSGQAAPQPEQEEAPPEEDPPDSTHQQKEQPEQPAVPKGGGEDKKMSIDDVLDSEAVRKLDALIEEYRRKKE